MKNLPTPIKNHFRHFFFNEESPDFFTEWLYTDNEIEESIGKEYYLSLLEIDYRKGDDVNKAKQIIQKLYDDHSPGQIAIDQAVSIAKKILDGSIDLHEGCRKLAHISSDWDNCVDRIFVAYADELDRLEDTHFYDDRILHEVKKLFQPLHDQKADFDL